MYSSLYCIAKKAIQMPVETMSGVNIVSRQINVSQANSSFTEEQMREQVRNRGFAIFFEFQLLCKVYVEHESLTCKTF